LGNFVVRMVSKGIRTAGIAKEGSKKVAERKFKPQKTSGGRTSWAFGSRCGQLKRG